MMNIEIKDARTANIVRDAIDAKVVDIQSLLRTEVDNDTMNMTSITELVTDINTLNEISGQINVKLSFGMTE